MPRPTVVPQVLEELMRKLAAGRWPPGSPLPPTRELAAELGVARRTLLAVLRLAERHGLLAVQPRQRIVVLPAARARSLDHLAQVAVAKGAGRLAVLIPAQHVPTREPFYRELIREIIDEAQRKNIAADVVPLAPNDQYRPDAVLAQHGYEAALCLAFGPAHLPALVLLLERRFPVMAFNRRLPGVAVPSVCVDDYGVARRTVRLLAELGHRDLCLVSGVTGACAGNGIGRLEGWFDALREASLLSSCSQPLYVVPPIKGARPFSRAFEAMMTLSRRPTALVFSGAPPAERFLADPRFRRLRIPEDLSVVVLEPGTQGVAVRGRPPLTAACINERRAAQCCVEMAGQLLSGRLHPPCIRVSADITRTDSVGRPPAALGNAGQP